MIHLKFREGCIYEYYPVAVTRMKKVLKEHGYKASRRDLVIIWESYSADLDASWLCLPDDDTELVEILVEQFDEEYLKNHMPSKKVEVINVDEVVTPVPTPIKEKKPRAVKAKEEVVIPNLEEQKELLVDVVQSLEEVQEITPTLTQLTPVKIHEQVEINKKALEELKEDFTELKDDLKNGIKLELPLNVLTKDDLDITDTELTKTLTQVFTQLFKAQSQKLDFIHNYLNDSGQLQPGKGALNPNDYSVDINIPQKEQEEEPKEDEEDLNEGSIDEDQGRKFLNTLKSKITNPVDLKKLCSDWYNLKTKNLSEKNDKGKITKTINPPWSQADLRDFLRKNHATRVDELTGIELVSGPIYEEQNNPPWN